MIDKQQGVALLNCCTSMEEVEAFKRLIADPEYYGVLTMHGRDGSVLHTLVPKIALDALANGQI